MRRSQRGLTVLRGLLLVAFVATLAYVNRTLTTELESGDDFAVAWTAGDLWLRQRISPYDPRVADQSRQLIFGRASAADAIRQPALFLLPLPSMLVFAPIASLPFPIARTLWMTIAELCLLASVVLTLRLVRWRGAPWLTGLVLIFSVLWYHGAQAVIAGSLAPVELLLLTGCLLAIQRRVDSVAGLLLGISSVMPQLSLPLIAFALLWGAAARRWTLVLWTCGTVLMLFGISVGLMPTWPIQWMAQLLKLFRAADARPIVLALLDFIPGVSNWMAAGFFLLVLIYLAWEWSAVMNQEDRWFLWTSTLTLTLTTLITYRTTTGVFVILLPGLILPLTVWLERWGRRAGWWIGLQWVALGGGLWWLFYRAPVVDQENLILFVLAPALTLTELWWIRWWASRSTRLPL